MRQLLVASLFLAAAATAASSAVITLPPARDNTLFESADGDLSNGSGPALFAGNNGLGLARRALVFFDVASLVPAWARIDSVVLTFRVSNAPNELLRRFELHRVLSSWGEGTSSATGGAGATAAPGDATWVNTFFPQQAWARPGGEFDPVPSAAALVAGLGDATWRGAGLTADVQAWLTQPATNHGWLVQGEETGVNTARRFDSRETADPAARPALTIYYSRATETPATWGSVKVRYR